jgi:hypothetical protein
MCNALEAMFAGLKSTLKKLFTVENLLPGRAVNKFLGTGWIF